MDASRLLESITGHPEYRGQVAHRQTFEPCPARYQDLGEPLPARLAQALSERGIERLFTHQARAVEAARRGDNLVVVTPTASGKTLCYNLPVLEHLLSHPGDTALYLFPTRALTRDQAETLSGFSLPLRAEVCDGDTPAADRARMREEADLVLTNPDMLHRTLLPQHLSWHRFFSRLRYVVVDEIHTYRGVLGSHVGHVLRRLRRLCRHYGSEPQFLLSSATIANPADHARRLTGLPVTLVDDNGAPRGRRHFVLWDPPPFQATEHEAVWLLHRCLEQQARTIVFSRARQATERILRRGRQSLPVPLGQRLVAYRGGYLARERRSIERALFQGELQGVVATNALELGIDVGELEVCIIAGFPGTIASTWQQAGRVGRRERESLVLMLTVANPLDQYFRRHPEALFSRPTEHALTDPGNPYILLGHIPCAARELAVGPEDRELWPPVFSELLPILEEDGMLVRQGQQWYFLGQQCPAQAVNLRTVGETFQIRDQDNPRRLVGTIDHYRACSETHPGAVYLHQGATYLVESLSLPDREVRLRRADLHYYTMARREKETAILETLGSREMIRSRVAYGPLQVTTRVVGYIKKDEFTRQILGGGELDLPPLEMETLGLWLEVDPEVCRQLEARHLDLMGGLHAVEHAAVGLLPLLAMCDRNDVGGLSTTGHPQTGGPTIFIHDAYPGGVGFSEQAFHSLEQLLETTLRALEECRCQAGCPACIHSPRCSNFNRPLDKDAALLILRLLLGREAELGAPAPSALRQSAGLQAARRRLGSRQMDM